MPEQNADKCRDKLLAREPQSNTLITGYPENLRYRIPCYKNNRIERDESSCR